MTSRTDIDQELTFIHPSDTEIYNTWDNRAFELQVANHELLGHGSGKLFEEDADGKKNFDLEKVSRDCFFKRCNNAHAFRSLILLQARKCTYNSTHIRHRLSMYTSTSWYKPGQSPGSVLGEVSSSMEECRAETVSLYCNMAKYSFYAERLLYF